MNDSSINGIKGDPTGLPYEMYYSSINFWFLVLWSEGSSQLKNSQGICFLSSLMSPQETNLLLPCLGIYLESDWIFPLILLNFFFCFNMYNLASYLYMFFKWEVFKFKNKSCIISILRLYFQAMETNYEEQYLLSSLNILFWKKTPSKKKSLPIDMRS